MEIVDIDTIGAQRWIRAPYRFYDDLDAHRPHHEGWLSEFIEGRPTSILSERCFLAARADNRIVGRVAVMKGPDHARFGLFECAPDALEAGPLLVDSAREIAREWGCSELVGPISADALYSIGALASGFDWVAPVFVDHSRPEFVSILDDCSPSEVRELQSWRWKTEWSMPAPARQIASATRAHPGLSLRPISRQRFEKIEAPILAELHADAYRETVAYQPLDADAFKWLLRNGEAVDPRCSSVVEIDGEPAGAVVATPNINEIGLTASEHERPWANLQERIIQAVKTPSSVRVFLFGVRQAYRGAAVGGLSTLLWDEFARRAREAGYTRVETPIVPATDTHRNNSLKVIGLRPAHRFRLYTFEV